MGGGKSGGSATVGYRYYMTLHMGLSRGPIDEIAEIKVGDKTAWPVAEGSSNGPDSPILDDRVTSINAGDLFGGDKKEGGISGSLTVCMGKAWQIFPDWMKAMMGGRVPDFRGVATVVFDGLLCSLNPYPKPWKFRLRRTTAGWDGDVWRQDLAAIWLADGRIKAMNPAHILYECATNRDWGRGLPRSRIDEASWLQAAAVLYNEGFGLCIRWTRQTELQEFAQSVLNHIGGAIYTDRETGLLTLRLLRADYNPSSLPLFDYNSGLISIEPEASSRDSIVNEVIVKYNDPLKNESRSVRAQNLASIQSLDSKNSTTTDYHGLPTQDLAARVAQRDLKASAAGVKRYNVVLDRRAWRLYPGGVLRVSAPDKGIANAVLRIGKVEDGSLPDGRIKVNAVLDVFGLSAVSFVDEQESEWVPPNPSPLIITNRIVREATYADLVGRLSPADLALVQPTAGAIATLAARPSPLNLGYSIHTGVSAEEYQQRGADSWATMVRLSQDVGHYDTVFPFDQTFDMGLAEVGDVLQINDEIVRVDQIVINELGQTGSLTVTRGCIDTIPSEHEAGSKAFFIGDSLGNDAREYALGEEVYVKLLSNTSSAELNINLAPTDTVFIQARQGRPYPPGNVRIGEAESLERVFEVSEVGAEFRIAWAHRDRLTQQDQAVGHNEPDIGPEAGTTYTLRFYYPSGTQIRPPMTGIVENFVDFDDTDDDLVGDIRIELESVRGGLPSSQRYSFEIDRTI